MRDPAEALIFGTMRLDALTPVNAVDLLVHLLRRGVRRFHSSAEYGSFALFGETLATACRRTGTAPSSLRHVVKAAAPHFGESDFSARDLRDRVGVHAASLGVESIDVVQWMVRHDLNDEPGRLRVLEQDERIGAAVAALAGEGLIHRFGCFPYTAGFRERVIRYPWCEVLVDYLNPLEQDCREVFDALRPEQSVIGIRPLLPLQPVARERVPKREWQIESLLSHALADARVEAVVVSTGSIAHADEIVAAMARGDG